MYPKNRKKKLDKQIEELNFTFIDELNEVHISRALEDNKKLLEEWFKDCSDFVLREFQIQNGPSALAVFVDGLIHTEAVNDMLRAIMIMEGGESQEDLLQM